jgi:hypothetical protein
MGTETAEQRITHLTWEDIIVLTRTLADQVRPHHFDLFLGISRGGLIPTAFLAKRLHHFDVVVASIMYYDANDQRLPEPIVLEMPPAEVLDGKTVLIIDDVWDSGNTIKRVRELVIQAGGTPMVATLHYKPGKSLNAGRPDFSAAETEEWIRYPWEAINGD